MDHREHRRIGPDTQGYREHNGYGETQIFAHGAQRILHVLPNRFEETDSAHKKAPGC